MKSKIEATNKTKKPTVRRKAAVATTAQSEPAPRRRSTAAKPKEEPATDRAKVVPGVSAEAVRERAYFLSLERQGVGDPVVDWLTAEHELSAQRD